MKPWVRKTRLNYLNSFKLGAFLSPWWGKRRGRQPFLENWSLSELLKGSLEFSFLGVLLVVATLGNLAKISATLRSLTSQDFLKSGGQD